MDNGQNDFCPKCGALMRDGVCQSCGNTSSQEDESYYTPLVNPPERTDLRALKEQRRPQTNQQVYGAPAQMPPNGQQVYGAPAQMPPNGQQVYGAPAQIPPNGQQMYGIPGQIPQNGMPMYYVPGQMSQNVPPNLNYGGGNGMPPTNVIPPVWAMPPQQNQKKNSNLAIIIVCIIAVLVMVFVVAAGIFMQRTIDKVREGQRNEPYAEEEWYEDDDDGDLYGTTPDAIYYEGLTDSIDYDVDYNFSFEQYLSMEEGEPDENLEYDVYYVLLDGEQIPNLEQINTQLEYFSKWYVDFVARERAEGGEECYVSSYAYVTYNDEHKISIVLSESVQIGPESRIALYPINVDLVNGIVLQNTGMIEIDADFVKDFRARSREQNGEVLADLTDEEIYNYMMDEDSLIVFYTPVGLEIGMNYVTKQGYSGWVTVTYKDYQNLLSLSG